MHQAVTKKLSGHETGGRYSCLEYLLVMKPRIGEGEPSANANFQCSIRMGRKKCRVDQVPRLALA